MAVKKKSDKRIKKENYWSRLQMVAQKYKNVMFVDANNVSSRQICMIRRKLRDIDAYMIMGKNVSAMFPHLFLFIAFILIPLKMSRIIMHQKCN
jgi:hypothetical protein